MEAGVTWILFLTVVNIVMLCISVSTALGARERVEQAERVAQDLRRFVISTTKRRRR